MLALASVVAGIAEMVAGRRIRIGRLCGGLVLAGAAVAVLAVDGWTQSYHDLAQDQLVAMVHADPVPGLEQTMQVVFTPVTDGKAGQSHTFTVKGDEWLLSGDVLSWQDWLNILGLRADYRITTLAGYYENAADYANKPVTAYRLDGSPDKVSRFLRQHTSLVPFVRVHSGNGVRMLPSTATYRVYLSASGFWTAQS